MPARRAIATSAEDAIVLYALSMGPSLEPERQAHVDALGPEVRALELERRLGGPLELGRGVLGDEVLWDVLIVRLIWLPGRITLLA